MSVRLGRNFAFERMRQRAFLTLYDGYITTLANGSRIANNFLDRAARNGYTLSPGDAFARTGAADAPFRANLAEDPGETRDLSAQEPARKTALIAAWEAYARDVGVVMPDPPTHPNPPRDHD